MSAAAARFAGARRDVRSLGAAAPLRAAYEVSKRLGGHAAVFGALRAVSASGMPPPFRRRLAPPAPVPPEAAERTLTAAAAIAGGGVELFGRRVRLDAPPAWHSLIDGGSEWPQRPWWEIDIRSGHRAGDVKWAWELGRHQHVVVLARAATLQPHEPCWPAALAGQLGSWLDQNPAELGVHWYSNLEIALRALAWTEVLDLAGDRLPAALAVAMRSTLRHAARHLLADLPYTLTTMRNNHLLGDGLGLSVIGRRLDRRLTALAGDRLFGGQLARHMRPDGSMIEDSLSYHRFVLELLQRRVLEGDAAQAVRTAMVDSAQFLCRLGVLHGPVPQYGDWDEGRALVSTGSAEDLRGSALLALALAGSGAPAGWRAAHDEVAWYAPPGEPVAPDGAEVAGNHVGGGIARAERGPFTVWLKAGGGPSHQHADLCSVAIAHRGRWLVGDPGTGTYNGPLEERTWFRSARAHSVLRLGGVDQLGPTRPFRWEHTATGVVGPPLQVGGAVVMWGAHDAYRRLPSSASVVRTVLVDAEGVLVADWVDAPGGPVDRWELALPLGPGVEWDRAPSQLRLDGSELISAELPGEAADHRGERRPRFEGWWSRTYASIEPATLLTVAGPEQQVVWWRIGGGLPAAVVDAAAHDEPLLQVGELRLAVSWAGPTARLTVSSPSWPDRRAYLRLP